MSTFVPKAAAITMGTPMRPDSGDLREEADLLPHHSTVVVSRTRLCLSALTREGHLANFVRQMHTRPTAVASQRFGSLHTSMQTMPPSGHCTHTHTLCTAVACTSMHHSRVDCGRTLQTKKN